MFAKFLPQFMTPNAFIDYCFYNVNALDSEELRQLAILGLRNREQPGTVIIVLPTTFRREQPRIHIAFGKSWKDKLTDEINTVVIAGVGSSILGTAALAKDVADRLNSPVIGVVSGTGLLSAPMDGFSGWFKYGPLNQMVDYWENFSKVFGSTPAVTDLVVTISGDASDNDPAQAVLQELITRTSTKRAIGHSKGSLEIANAVIADDNSLRNRTEKLKIGTLGSVVALPDCVESCQVLGSLDEIGLLNSRADVPRHIVWDASHWLNPQIPFSMSIRDHVWGKFGNTTAFS